MHDNRDDHKGLVVGDHPRFRRSLSRPTFMLAESLRVLERASATIQLRETMLADGGEVADPSSRARPKAAMRRRARVDRDGTLRCRKCGSRNLLARSDDRAKKTRSLKCADCDERQSWRDPALGAV